MTLIYRKFAKNLLFKLDPEKAHHMTIDGLARAGRYPSMLAMLEKLYGVPDTPELSVQLCGVTFPNPVGLAAGLDKNGQAVPGFSSIGFGFMEVGTVTPKPQPGNELPRLFRLPEDRALINRMGFNNVGADAMAEHLKSYPVHKVPVAINIGKNKSTPNERAEDDYRHCIRTLYPYGDLFVVNISSPNTPDLRNLQHGDDLKRLLSAVNEEMEAQQRQFPQKRKPIFVKIAPDLTEVELEYIMETIVNSGVSGVIATNTTIRRDGLTDPNAQESGGLSGKPLTNRSTEVIRSIYRRTGGKLPIIGCGGIFSAQDAYDKIRAGASLVEIYTALIYEGPEIIREINEGIRMLMKQDQFTHIGQAVGADH